MVWQCFFLMPGIFLLVMSFALKNTLTSEDIALPRTGWVIEEKSPLAANWSNDWIERKGGERFASRSSLLDALRARHVQAGVIVQDEWVDAKGTPRIERIELWLSNRIEPASAGRLRAEVTASMLQLQLKRRVAAAGSSAACSWTTHLEPICSRPWPDDDPLSATKSSPGER